MTNEEVAELKRIVEYAPEGAVSFNGDEYEDEFGLVYKKHRWVDCGTDYGESVPLSVYRTILKQHEEIERLRDALSEVKRMVEPHPQVRSILKITEQALKGESE